MFFKKALHPNNSVRWNFVLPIILAQFFNKFADIIMRDGLLFGQNGIAIAKKGQTWLEGINWRVSGKSFSC
jgi:hypothetical protein